MRKMLNKVLTKIYKYAIVRSTDTVQRKHAFRNTVYLHRPSKTNNYGTYFDKKEELNIQFAMCSEYFIDAAFTCRVVCCWIVFGWIEECDPCLPPR